MSNGKTLPVKKDERNKKAHKLGMVVHTCNSIYWGDVGGSR
jgi:hypothetical protein